MLLRNKRVTTKKIKSEDEREILQIVNDWLLKNKAITSIYVSPDIYNLIHLQVIKGIPIYAGSGIDHHEIMLVE